MNVSGWIQLAVFIPGAAGGYQADWPLPAAVLDANGKLSGPGNQAHRELTYKLGGIDPAEEQDWRRYATARCWFSAW